MTKVGIMSLKILLKINGGHCDDDAAGTAARPPILSVVLTSKEIELTGYSNPRLN